MSFRMEQWARLSSPSPLLYCQGSGPGARRCARTWSMCDSPHGSRCRGPVTAEPLRSFIIDSADMRWAEQEWQRGRARHKTYLVQSEREGKENNSQETDGGPVICSGRIFEQTDEGEAKHQLVWDRQPQSSASQQLSASPGETSPCRSPVLVRAVSRRHMGSLGRVAPELLPSKRAFDPNWVGHCLSLSHKQ